MLVEEVSLVDRAANKRRFLVTKRGAGMKDGKDGTVALQPDGKGGLEVVAPDTSSVDVEKQNAGEKLQSAIDRLMSVANKVKEGDDPGGYAGELKQIGALMASVTEKYPSPTAKTGGETGDKPVESAATSEPVATSPATPVASGAAPTETVAKAGTRMKKERLDRFRSFVKGLTELLSEIEPEIEAATTAPPQVPSAGTAQVGKVDPNPEMLAAIKKSEETITALQAQVKTQQERIEKLAKTTPAPSSLPVEQRRGVEKKTSVSWPMDLNMKLDRESVGKDVSFHD